MRGSRCKALRKLFKSGEGREPHKMYFIGDGRYVPSEWRRLKKVYKDAVRSGVSRGWSL